MRCRAMLVVVVVVTAAMPPGLVEPEANFDKNPRLATVVGFLVITAATSHN